MATATRAARIVCFSAFAANLRAVAIIRGLQQRGYEIIVPRSHGPPGSIQELALTVLPYCWTALVCPADVAVGFKPHLNVTLPLLICKLRGIATWVDVDDLDHAYREGWISRVVELMQRPFPRLCRVVSYHNLRLQEFLLTAMRCTPRQLVRVEQGVDYEFFSRPPPSALLDALRAVIKPAGRLLAVYTAHLNVASDLEPMLQAWQKVTRRLPQATLLVVGGGPLLGHYRAMTERLGLQSTVTFTGEVAHTEVPLYFALADVALLYFSPRLVNSYRCSLKLREYLAAGLRIVCNDVGELPEYAPLTYQTSSDLDEFAAMIVQVLNGQTDGREHTGHAFACHQLDWKQIVATVDEAIVGPLLGPAAR